MKKFTLAIILLLFGTAYSATVLFAQESRFSFYYDIKYQVNESGQTKVTQKTTITNLTTNFLAQKSKVFLGQSTARNIKVYDSFGTLPFQELNGERGKEIGVNFGNPAAGKGKKFTWVLTFDSDEVLVKQGNMYQVYLPKPALENELSDFKITLEVPASFGKALYLRPDPEKSGSWTKLSVGKAKGINLTFLPQEKHQYYNVNLKYALHNDTNIAVFAEVPVPADTLGQIFYWEKSEPRPTNVTVDENGNWLARYYLGAKSSLDVLVEGLVELVPQTSPKDNPAALEEAYRFVTSNFRFDPKASPKPRPTKHLLENPGSATCQEIVQVLMEIASAKGYSLMTVEGVVYPRTNSLHCWAIYLDSRESSWRMLDPVLEITSGGWNYFGQADLAHIAIVRKGAAGELPSLGLDSIEVKPVVNLNPGLHQSSINLRADLPKQQISGTSFKARIVVENDGPAILGGEQLIVRTTKTIAKPQTQALDLLPPFASKELAIDFEGKDWFYLGHDIITLRIKDKNYTFLVDLTPFYLTKTFIFAGGLLLVYSLLRFTQITRSLRFPRFKR